MPTVAYEVIVGVSGEMCSRQNEAIAEASRFLGSCDTTNTMEFARISEVHAYDGDRGMDWGISLHFSVPIGLAEDKAAFERELDTLAHVETWQELPVSEV